MTKQKYITKSNKETKKLGEKFVQEIFRTKFKKGAFVIGLKGELGGGKTTFMQGFAKGLKIKEKITSPTFVILKRFQINNLTNKQFSDLYHIDCYRLNRQKDLLDLGFKKIVSNAQNIVVVEWADQVKKIMPQNTIWIKFKFIDENKRKIIFESD